MNIKPFLRLAITVSILVNLFSCVKDEETTIPAPKTIEFNLLLSDYNIYDGNLSDLIPASDYHILELNASLFVNYAQKQRLIKLPVGTKMTYDGDDLPIFPEGTILVKTFYYFNNESNPSSGKRIIESRLMIKSLGEWNVATYIWNSSQTEATLDFNGLTTDVSWIDKSGVSKTTKYKIPSEKNCVTCHQSYSQVKPLGPKLRNLNMTVVRNSNTINQLQYLQSSGLIDNFDHNSIATLANYKDLTQPLERRGRAYLEMNCAHCHNPGGFSKAKNKGYDFRYTTPIGQTKILGKQAKIKKEMGSGDMPYIGTSIRDEEGYQLVQDYLNSL